MLNKPILLRCLVSSTPAAKVDIPAEPKTVVIPNLPTVVNTANTVPLITNTCEHLFLIALLSDYLLFYLFKECSVVIQSFSCCSKPV